MRRSTESRTPGLPKEGGLFDDDLDTDNFCDEIEMIDATHSSVHPKKGRSRNARRYIEDYWEQKQFEQLQKDIFDED